MTAANKGTGPTLRKKREAWGTRYDMVAARRILHMKRGPSTRVARERDAARDDNFQQKRFVVAAPANLRAAGCAHPE
jgi:hypothetical protein